jgi:hypothetical protein
MWNSIYLKRQDNLLGTLTVYKTDFPWIYCQFKPTSEFESVKPFFDKELELVNSEADWDEWDKTYQTLLDMNVRMIDTLTGEESREFLLHIDGDEAWFRY